MQVLAIQVEVHTACVHFGPAKISVLSISNSPSHFGTGLLLTVRLILKCEFLLRLLVVRNQQYFEAEVCAADYICPSRAQIGNLQAIAQFLCNASKSLSGTLADVLSPARMIIFGTVLTTLNKPMFAGSGAVYAAFGTVATLYWVTAGARSMRHCSVAACGDSACEAVPRLRQSIKVAEAFATTSSGTHIMCCVSPT